MAASRNVPSRNVPSRNVPSRNVPSRNVYMDFEALGKHSLIDSNGTLHLPNFSFQCQVLFKRL
jgi:hypothetical protein